MDTTIQFLRVLLCDLKRALFSGRFLLGIGLGLVALYQPAYPFGFFEGAVFQGNSLIGAIQDTFGLGAFIMCCAVLCALPYADAHSWEVSSGEYPYILSRAGTRQYVLSKIISTALSGGLVLCTPFLLFCLVQAFAFAPSQTGVEDWSAAYFAARALLRYGACWSLCGLCLSSWLASPFVALAIPFCVTRFLWLLSAFTGWNVLDPSMAIGSVTPTSVVSPEQIVSLQLFFSLIFIVLLILGVNRKKC